MIILPCINNGKIYNKNNANKTVKCVAKNLSSKSNIDLLQTPNALYNMNLINFKARIEKYEHMTNDKKTYLGCIVGGAIGDAFGAKIEAWSYEDIKKTFGELGLRNLLSRNGIAKFTDDTQMTLFTIYALIRNKLQNKGVIEKNSCIEELKQAYLEWNFTQNQAFSKNTTNNLLLNEDLMYSKRFPGNTCLQATSSIENMGSIDKPSNDSMGNGAVMRSAPIGLVLSDNPDFAFELATEAAALTHGHPIGYYSAGAFAYLIANLTQGNDLNESIQATQKKLAKYGESGEEIASIIKKAVELTNYDLEDHEAISQLGKGFLAHESLAIAIYSSLKYQDNFKLGIISAVNHDGDSDTTGAIAGNILGAYMGIENIPSKYTTKIEGQYLIEKLTSDLYSSITEIENPKSRYNCEPVFATLEDRRKDDRFEFVKQKTRFSQEEIAIMKSLPFKEAVAYRNSLIRRR